MKYQLANNEDAQYVRGSTNVSIFNIDTSIKALQTDKQDKNFVVTFTPTWQEDEFHSFTATADKTFAETLAAYNAGKTVTGILLNGYIENRPTPLSCCDAASDMLQFVQPCVPYGQWACGLVWQTNGTVGGAAWTQLFQEEADTRYASINGSDSSNFNAAQLSASSVKINNVGTLSLNAPNIQLSNSTGNGVYTFDSQKTGTVAVTSDIPDISGKADTTTVNAALALKADKAFIVHLTQEVDGETTTYSVDKTVAEMHAAVANGQSVYIAMQEGNTIQYANISVIQPYAAVVSSIYLNNLMEIFLNDNNGSTYVSVTAWAIASEDFVHGLTDNKETKTTIENVNSATISQTISSNKLYIFGSTTTPVTSFTLTGLTETETTPYVNKYHGFIYCGDDMSFTIPVTIKIANDQTLPLFASGHLFEFSILNNILTFTYTTL